METHVLKGSKREIAESLLQIVGEVREVIVFVEEPAASVPVASPDVDQDIFAEMVPFMVDVREVDDSRDAIYSYHPSSRVAVVYRVDRERFEFRP